MNPNRKLPSHRLGRFATTDRGHPSYGDPIEHYKRPWGPRLVVPLLALVLCLVLTLCAIAGARP